MSATDSKAFLGRISVAIIILSSKLILLACGSAAAATAGSQPPPPLEYSNGNLMVGVEVLGESGARRLYCVDLTSLEQEKEEGERQRGGGCSFRRPNGTWILLSSETAAGRGRRCSYEIPNLEAADRGNCNTQSLYVCVYETGLLVFGQTSRKQHRCTLRAKLLYVLRESGFNYNLEGVKKARSLSLSQVNGCAPSLGLGRYTRRSWSSLFLVVGRAS